LNRCIRVLILINTDREPRELVNVYLRGTDTLRS
jgi:chorismate mutase